MSKPPRNRLDFEKKKPTNTPVVSYVCNETLTMKKTTPAVRTRIAPKLVFASRVCYFFVLIARTSGSVCIYGLMKGTVVKDTVQIKLNTSGIPTMLSSSSVEAYINSR